MRVIQAVGRGLLATLKVLQLALPKVGVGWMFALLTIDFNRIAIFELGIAAILVTTMLGMNHLFSPFQVFFGRIADQNPIFGFRRTPYLIISGIVSSLIFISLPTVVHAMADGFVLAFIGGYALLILFGVSSAATGDSHNALIVEATTPKTRGMVVSVVQIITILSTIIAAVVMNIVRPEYSPEAMQRLYNLTPFVVLGAMALGLIRMEKRLKGEELRASVAKARAAVPEGNPFGVAFGVLRTNRQARGFFFFISLSIFSIFLQDNILEVFGAEVFGLSVAETTKFQPTWGGGVLVGMLVMGALSVFLPITKKRIAQIGCYGTAVGMSILAFAALTHTEELVHPALLFMGVFTGFFNVGALAMMMEMTIEGAVGMYMGLWGVAQALGTFTASTTSGALHTSLIGSGFLEPGVAYMGIFALEAVGMLTTAYILAHLSTQRFREVHESRLTRRDLEQALEAGALA